MVTKAIIKRLPTLDDNHFQVYVPFLRKANADESDALLTATLSYIPGIQNTLQVGDVVFVTFEDNNEDKPVILGSLFTGREDQGSITTTITVKSLDVTEVNKIPENTKIGDINIQEIQQKLNDLYEKDQVLYSGNKLTINDVKELLESLLSD